jgi:hypothetical protein
MLIKKGKVVDKEYTTVLDPNSHLSYLPEEYFDV